MSFGAKLLIIGGCAAMVAGCNPPKQPKPSPTPIPKWALGKLWAEAPFVAEVGEPEWSPNGERPSRV